MRKLCFSVKDRGRVWKDYMEMTVNEENDWGHDVGRDAAESSVHCMSWCWHKMKTGKAHGPSGLSLELIAASGEN